MLGGDTLNSKHSDHVEQRCDECDGRIIEQNGLCICQSCGLVHAPVIENSSFQLGTVTSKEQRKKQQYTSVNNQLSVVSSLGSSIGAVEEYIFRDAQGSLIDDHSQAKFRKLKNFYHISSAVKGKETDYRTLKIMDKVFSCLKIKNNTRNRACYLYHSYKKIHKDKVSNHVLLSALCLLLAVREEKHNCPITLKEIVETYRGLGHRVLGTNLSKLMIKLDVKSPTICIRRSEDYLARMCSEICSHPPINERIQRKYRLDIFVYEKILFLASLKLLARITFRQRGGKNALCFAAATAYVIDKNLCKPLFNSSSALTQKMVARATGVAEFTIRERAEFILSYFTEDILTDISKELSRSF